VIWLAVKFHSKYESQDLAMVVSDGSPHQDFCLAGIYRIVNSFLNIKVCS